MNKMVSLVSKILSSTRFVSRRSYFTSIIRPQWGHVDTPQNNLSIPFEFNEENKKRALNIIKCYPRDGKRAALMPLCDLAMRQHGWLTISAIYKIAKYIDLEGPEVVDVVVYYRNFVRQPIGMYNIQICTTTPCYLRGCDQILKYYMKTLDIKENGTTRDGKFTLTPKMCMGACVNAPVMAINDDYYEDLTLNDAINILEAIQEGCYPTPGPYSGRHCCEPLCGLTSLKEEPKEPDFGLQCCFKDTCD